MRQLLTSEFRHKADARGYDAFFAKLTNLASNDRAIASSTSPRLPPSIDGPGHRVADLKMGLR